MQPTRRARLEAVIKEELAIIIPRELKDPRIPQITLTSVMVSNDAQNATAYISIFGGAKGGLCGEPTLSDEEAGLKMENCLSGLKSASGFLRRHLGKVLNTRSVPHLFFKEDKGLENTNRVHELLKQISNPNGKDPK